VIDGERPALASPVVAEAEPAHEETST
jgi:hypothetical protein